MVRVGILYFQPQDQRRYNNSSLVRHIEKHKCTDISFIELPVPWNEAKPIISQIYKNFDVILAFGESDNLREHAQVEMVAKVKGKIAKNQNKFPFTNYIKINNEYDPSNNFTCNSLNFYLLKRNVYSVFVHVPVSRSKNLKIREDVEYLIDYMCSDIRVHTIQAKIERKFTRGYTNVHTTPCQTGIYFPFNQHEFHEMTMENTPIDLDVLFLDEEKRIVSIKKGLAYNNILADFAYSVLEIPSPYCKINYVQRGDYVKISKTNPKKISCTKNGYVCRGR